MTRQVSDILIYEGKEYPLLNSIELPDNNTSVVKLSDKEFKHGYLVIFVIIYNIILEGF